MANYIHSPLNYTGGKYKLLNSIFAHFPKTQIGTFVDLFGGGFNVGVNVDADRIIYNDIIPQLSELFYYFKSTPIDDIINSIDNIINEYELSITNANGYNKLRSDYNQSHNIVLFFVLICYSFNHQIRFNSSGEFNMPFGKNRSSFNENTRENLIRFCKAIQKKDVAFLNAPFSTFDFSNLSSADLVYCDPPYLITCATYNEQDGWDEIKEKALLKLLDELNERGVKFALSNVFYHKGNENTLLIEWSRKYFTYYLDMTYMNCNYHVKPQNDSTVEVLITNFKSDCGNYRSRDLF